MVAALEHIETEKSICFIFLPLRWIICFDFGIVLCRRIILSLAGERLLSGESLVEFKDLGRWWGTDPSTRSQAEIDIMGEQDKDTALFGECQWTNEKVDAGILETLARRSRIFHYSEIQLYLFAKNGFTKGCMEAADKMGNVVLVSYKDLLKRMMD